MNEHKKQLSMHDGNRLGLLSGIFNFAFVSDFHWALEIFPSESLSSRTSMIVRFRATSANGFVGITPFVNGLLADGLAFSFCFFAAAVGGTNLKLGKTAFAQTIYTWSSFVNSSLVGDCSSSEQVGNPKLHIPYHMFKLSQRS